MLAIVSLTIGGADLSLQLKRFFPEAICYGKYGQENGIILIKKPMKEWLQEKFNQYDQWIFIMATGIVVRSLNNLLNHKSQDPAVLVMDEKGDYVISLLSGHLGGANQLARRIAYLMGAQPVITTSSDVQGLLAVDELAMDMGLALFDYDRALKVTSDLVNGKSVGFWSEEKTQVPKGYQTYWGRDGWRCLQEDLLQGRLASFVAMSDKPVDLDYPFVQLYPQRLVVGIGCKKNTPKESIRSGILKMIEAEGYSRYAISQISSAWVKRDEIGIMSLASEWKISFATYTKEAILQVADDFDGSQFVEKTIGVPCVSEPCGYLAANGGECLVPVIKKNGMTLSLWRKKEGKV